MSQLLDYDQINIAIDKNNIDLTDVLSRLFEINDISRHMSRSDSLILRQVDLKTYQRLLSDARNKLKSNITPSGTSYHKKWEDGWGENLSEFSRTGSIKSLYPFYIKNNNYFRLSGNYFTSENVYFELDLAKTVINYYFEKYLFKSNTIIDLGSGSNHYTIDLNLRNTDKNFFALDWSNNSNSIIIEANKKFSINITPVKFDMFDPFNQNFKVNKSSSVYTVGSLEQLGTSYDKILKWFLISNFDYVMNIEPIYEFYDLNKSFDLVAAKYIKKRNWLRGYYASLLDLEKKGTIKILEKLRLFGSLYHETYNFIIWRKI